MRQQGVNGEKTQVYDVTYVDGVAESETLKSETVTSMAIDQIIAVGAAKSDTDKGSDKKSDSADNGKADSGPTISTSRPTTMPATPRQQLRQHRQFRQHRRQQLRQHRQFR